MSQSANSIRLAITTTGSSGSAVGELTTNVPGGIRGYLYSVYLDYHASAPSGTDLVISEVGGPARTFLTLTDVNTDGERPIRRSTVGVTGATDGGSAPFALAGTQIKVAVSGSNALTDAVVATLYLLQ